MNCLAFSPLPICELSGKLTRPCFRDFIWEHELLLAPPSGRPRSWTYSDYCLWDAPDYLTTKWALLPSLAHLNTPILTVFFQNTLDIKDVAWSDLIEELGEGIKAKGKPDIKVVRDIYLRLQKMSVDLDPGDLKSIL
jgi:hypothetical protein